MVEVPYMIKHIYVPPFFMTHLMTTKLRCTIDVLHNVARCLNADVVCNNVIGWSLPGGCDS